MPTLSWSISSFSSHDPLLSPFDERPTLSSLTCPLITCTGSRLIFTRENPPSLCSQRLPFSPILTPRAYTILSFCKIKKDSVPLQSEAFMDTLLSCAWMTGWEEFAGLVKCEEQVFTLPPLHLSVSLFSLQRIITHCVQIQRTWKKISASHSQPLSHTLSHTVYPLLDYSPSAATVSHSFFLSPHSVTPPPSLSVPFNHPLSSVLLLTNHSPASLCSKAPPPPSCCPLLTVQFTQEAHGMGHSGTLWVHSKI